DTLGRQVDDLGSLFLGDQVRTGRNIAARHQAIFGVEREEGDGQVALQVLLLIDGEGGLAVNDGLQEAGRHVEGADVDLAFHAGFGDRGQGRLACSGRTEAHDRVNGAVRRE